VSYDLKAFYDSVDELTTRDRCLSVMYGRVPDSLGGGLVPVGVDASGNLQLGTNITLNVSEITPVNVVQPNPALLQTSTNLIAVNGSTISLGQNTMLNSLPVTIASDQSVIPVLLSGASTVTVVQPAGSLLNATVTGTVTSNIGTTGGLALQSTLLAILNDVNNFTFSANGLKVDGSGVTQPVSGTFWQTTQPISGTVTANAGTGNFNVVQASGANLHVDVDNFPATQPISGTIAVSNFPATQPISGTVAATQSGTWNLNNISGTITLPTGAATAANQTTANTSLATIAANTPPLGQTTEAGSVPVTIASNQSAIPVTITGDTFDVVANIAEWGGVATSLGQTVMASSVPVTIASNQSALPVTGTFWQTTQPISGTVTANAGAGTFTVGQATGTNLHTVVDNFPATQPISGTVTATQGTSPWVISGTVAANAGTGNFTVVQPTGTSLHTVVDNFPATQVVSVSNFPSIQPISGTVTSTQGTSPWVISGTVGATQSGSWTITSLQGTTPWVENLTQVGGSTIALGQTTMVNSLPVTIASNQTAIPVSISGDTITLSENIAQWGGVATSLGQKVMASSVPVTLSSDQSALPVTGTFWQTTQPVSGTVTANAGTGTFTVGQATAANLNATVVGSGNFTVVQPSGASLHVDVDNFPATQPVSGTVAVSNFPATQAVTQSGTWTVAATESGTWNVGLNAGSNTIGAVTQASGPWTVNLVDVGGAALALGQTTMSASVPVTIASNQSALAVTGTFWQAIQPVSGTVTANAGTGNFTVVQPLGSSLHVDVDNFPATQAVTQSGTWTVAATESGTWNVGLTAGANTIGAVTQASGPWTQNLTEVGGAAIALGQTTMSASVPVTIASNQSALPVTGTFFQATQPVSGTVTANQGTANTVANAWPIEVTNGTSTAFVTPASTAAAAGNPALVVALSPNTPLPTGTNTIGELTPNQSVNLTQVGGASLALGQAAAAGSVPVVTQADFAPVTQAITAEDIVSTTTAVANGQVYITGIPTAGSAATFALASQESIVVEVTGVWTGTLETETSMDGGTTWLVKGAKQIGSSYLTTTFTANFTGVSNVAGMTNYRVRATTAWTGTATIRVVASINDSSIVVSNPLTLRDSTTQSITNTIKAASTAAVATDTALVVAISPNSPLPTPSDFNTTGTITALNGSVVLPIHGAASALVELSGTWVGSVQVQGLEPDGVTWAMLTTAITPTGSGIFSTTVITANGLYRTVSTSAYTSIRATATAFTSGPINVAITASTAPTVAQCVQLTAANLNAQVFGASADGVTAAPNPVVVGGGTLGGVVETMTVDANGNVAVVGSVAAGTADSGNGVKISGVYNTTVPALTNGQRGDLQVDSRSAQLTTPLDGSRATYSASAGPITFAATATDIFTIAGSATKTIRVTKLVVEMTETTAATETILLIKRSAANTGGTVAHPTGVPNDSNNAAATAVITTYTANPTTLGAAVGTMVTRLARIPPATAFTVPPSETGIILVDAVRPSQAIVLRGVAQVLAINFGGGTAAGNSTGYYVEWTEE
jgi:hypothetical protein